jgi:hypothetical protein
MHSLRQLLALFLAHFFAFVPGVALSLWAAGAGMSSWLSIVLLFGWVPVGVALWFWLVLPRLCD